MGEWARNEIKRKRKIAVRTELLLVNSAQTNIKYIILSIVCKCNPPNSFVFVSIRSVDRLNKTATRNKMQWTNGKRWETRKIKKFFFSSVVVAVRRSSSTVTFIACVYTVFSECRRFFIWTSHRPMRPGQPERDSFFLLLLFRLCRHRIVDVVVVCRSNAAADWTRRKCAFSCYLWMLSGCLDAIKWLPFAACSNIFRHCVSKKRRKCERERERESDSRSKKKQTNHI